LDDALDAIFTEFMMAAVALAKKFPNLSGRNSL